MKRPNYYWLRKIKWQQQQEFMDEFLENLKQQHEVKRKEEILKAEQTIKYYQTIAKGGL